MEEMVKAIFPNAVIKEHKDTFSGEVFIVVVDDDDNVLSDFKKNESEAWQSVLTKHFEL